MDQTFASRTRRHFTSVSSPTPTLPAPHSALRHLPHLSSNDALSVLVFLGSTRQGIPPPTTPGGAGVRVGTWCAEELRLRGHTVTVVDPLDTNLPLLRQPHFGYRVGEAPAVLEELASEIRGADAYVMVTPEYNHAPSPALLNTLNHFGSRWAWGGGGVEGGGGGQRGGGKEGAGSGGGGGGGGGG